MPHLHSYLLAFRGGVLARDPLRGFFAGVRPQESKRAVIHTYEIGLSNLVRAHGLTTEVGWTKDDLGVDGETDSLLGGWALLLTHGFPFVKRLLLEGKQFADVRDAVPVGVRQEYGVQLG